jgi:hypothetical protein
VYEGATETFFYRDLTDGDHDAPFHEGKEAFTDKLSTLPRRRLRLESHNYPRAVSGLPGAQSLTHNKQNANTPLTHGLVWSPSCA